MVDVVVVVVSASRHLLTVVTRVALVSVALVVRGCWWLTTAASDSGLVSVQLI